jgi:hypothetical protein
MHAVLNSILSSFSRAFSFDSRPRKLLLFGGSVTLLSAGLFAQQKIAPPKEENIIQLSPFQVDATRDTGYYSSQTLAGGRLNTNLKDIATTVQVVTQEMLDDLGATSMDQVFAYTTNTDAVGKLSNYAAIQDGDGGGTLDQSDVRQDPSAGTRVRGMAAPTRTTNYFETSIPFDSYNSGRLDINRGANSFLFGLGSPGGIVNNSLANAETHRDSFKVTYQLSTEDFEDNYSNRVAMDANQVIVKNRLAVRFAAVEKHDEFMQKPAYAESSRRYVAISLKPFASHAIKVNANHETGNIASVPVDRLGPLQTLSSFLNDPYGTVWGPVGKVTNATGRRITDAFGNILLNNRGGNVGYLGRDKNGGILNTTQYDVFLKRNGWASVYDGTEDANGLPTRAVATGWTTNRIGRGSPTFDPDNNLTGNSSAVLTRNLNYRDLVGLPQYDGYVNQGLVNYDVFDFRRHLLTGSIDNYQNKFDRTMATLEAVSKGGRVGMELAYAREKWTQDSYVAVRAPSIDIDQNYSFTIGPNALFGDTNPNFGRLYFYAPSAKQTLNTNKRESFRATAFAKFDFKEKFRDGLWRWLGRHTLTGLYDDNTLNQKQFADQPLVFGNDVAFHLGQASATIFQRQWSGIFYISDPYLRAFENPGFKLSDFKTAGLVPSVSVKYPAGVQIPIAYLSGGDPTKDASFNQPLGNETTKVGAYTPAFAPFSGVLTRTKTKSMALNMQSFFFQDHLVANLGWRRDEVSLSRNGTPPLNPDLTPIRDPAVFNLDGTAAWVEKANNFSYGLVLKTPARYLPAGVSLSWHYGHSSNFVPNPGGFDFSGKSVPSASGTTREAGFTAGVMNDKLVLRVNAYRGRIKNENFSGTSAAYGRLADANVARNYNGMYLDMDQYDRNRDGVFDPIQDPLDPSGKTFIDPDRNKNGILDVVEPGGANYIAGAKYMPLDQFIKLFDQLGAHYNDWARKTAESVLIPGTISGNNSDAVANSGPGLSSTLTDTVDLEAKGYELELIYNPTKNLRFSLNLARQEARRSNIAPRLTEMVKTLIAISESVPTGPYLVGSQQVEDRLTRPLATTPFASSNMVGFWLTDPSVGGVYYTQTALAGSDNPEVRKYRANLLGNYSFSEGKLRGVNVGGAFRWLDKAAIGYPVTYTADTHVLIKDVAHPYYDDATQFVDVWVGYKRKLLQGRMGWKVQLNIRNLLADSSPVTVQVQPEGSVARVGMPVPREFVLSNTFSF